VHDLEDAIQLKLIDRSKCDTDELRSILAQTDFSKSQQGLLDLLFSESISERKEAISKLVNYFVTSVEVKISNHDFTSDLLKYQAFLLPESAVLLEYFKNCIYNFVIDSQSSRIFEYSGQIIVQRLFEAFSSNPEDLLDIKNRNLYVNCQNQNQANRVISDYIANMTDGRAHAMHSQLFGFSPTNIDNFRT
jgi:dGTPase